MEKFLEHAAAESVIGAYHDLYSKYKYMETSFEKSKGVYKSKIPDLEQTIELVKVLTAKQDEGEDASINYNICDMIYSRATV